MRTPRGYIMRTSNAVRRSTALLVLLLAATATFGAVSPATAGAAPACNSADFTFDGEFNLEGYLACLAGGYQPPPPGTDIQWPTNDSGQSFIEPGQETTAVFCCFTPGSEFYATIDTGTAAISSQELIRIGPFIVGPDGAVEVTIPALPAGNFQMVVQVDGQTFAIPLLIGVVIPEAGSNIMPILGIAAGLVAIGLGAVGTTIRRRRAVAA